MMPAPSALPAREFVERIPPQFRVNLDAREIALTTALSGTNIPAPKSGVTRGRYVLTTAQKWTPGHRLTVAFSGGSTQLRQKIIEAALAWTAITDASKHHPDITLDFGAPPGSRDWTPNDGDFAADVRVAFDSADPNMQGYWSAIGEDSVNRVIGWQPGQPSIMFYYFDRELPSDWQAIVMHEFGHVFGFQHEHQSPRGGCDFRWADDPGYEETHEFSDASHPLVADSSGRKPGVYSWFAGPYNYWDASAVDRNLKVLPSSDAYDTGVFDKSSIMEYFFPAILFIGGSRGPCYISRENASISSQDQQGFFRAYPPAEVAERQVVQKRIQIISAALASPDLSPDTRASLAAKNVSLKDSL
jgi:hypothetical protein